MLVTVVLTLLSSYQEYMVNIVRNKGNWEAKFTNITYEQAKEIEKDKNIKEISIIQKLGITEPIYQFDFIKINLNVRAYNLNALKNEKLELIRGRMPQNENEIIIAIHPQTNIEEMPRNIGDKIETKINGEEKIYTIVGEAYNIVFDNRKSMGSNYIS